MELDQLYVRRKEDHVEFPGIKLDLPRDANEEAGGL